MSPFKRCSCNRKQQMPIGKLCSFLHLTEVVFIMVYIKKVLKLTESSNTYVVLLIFNNLVYFLGEIVRYVTLRIKNKYSICSIVVLYCCPINDNSNLVQALVLYIHIILIFVFGKSIKFVLPPILYALVLLISR